MPSALHPPAPSALSALISRHGAKTESPSLPLEILHNVQHQHKWVSLRLHAIVNRQLLDITTTLTTSSSDQIYLISGLPPKHAYIHPDFQNQLLRQNIAEKDVAVQREWVLPMSLGEKWNLKRFAGVFDALPERETMGKASGQGDLDIEWKDARRVVLGMLATNGKGGDGTVVYYIMQEGEVKPRQNG